MATLYLELLVYCPFCTDEETKVIDSRLVAEGSQVRRRRECQACGERFTTFETAELVMPSVIKNNDSRQPFDKSKLRNGLLRALEKRPVDIETYAAQQWGLNVLAVDLDPQANLSQALMTKDEYAIFMDEKQPCIVELFDGFAPATQNKLGPSPLESMDIIKQVSLGWRSTEGNLEVIPSRFDFSDNLVSSTKVEPKVLAKFIAEHMQHKDLILIDCAPTESILTIASYHASRYVLIPVKTEFFSTIGFPLMEQSLDDFRGKNRGHKIDVCGIVVHTIKTSGSGNSKDGWDSLFGIEKQAKAYGWDILKNRMHHSDSYPKWARDPHAVHLGNAEGEWPKVAEEILAKIGLSKQETQQ